MDASHPLERLRSESAEGASGQRVRGEDEFTGCSGRGLGSGKGEAVGALHDAGVDIKDLEVWR